jgi:hypothetical protein
MYEMKITTEEKLWYLQVIGSDRCGHHLISSLTTHYLHAIAKLLNRFANESLVNLFNFKPKCKEQRDSDSAVVSKETQHYLLTFALVIKWQ